MLEAIAFAILIVSTAILGYLMQIARTLATTLSDPCQESGR
jgi:hypothetical protein